MVISNVVTCPRPASCLLNSLALPTTSTRIWSRCRYWLATLATSAVVISTDGVASASTGPKIPASAFSDHTGITKTEVKLANVSTLTIGLFKGADVGAQAYADYVNSTGGINGRKLVLTDFDDQFGGAGNKQATQNAIENDFAMVGNFSLEDSYGGALLKSDPGVPDVSVVLDPGTNKLPNVFSAVPLNAGWEEGGGPGFQSTDDRGADRRAQQADGGFAGDRGARAGCGEPGNRSSCRCAEERGGCQCGAQCEKGGARGCAEPTGDCREAGGGSARG